MKLIEETQINTSHVFPKSNYKCEIYTKAKLIVQFTH